MGHRVLANSRPPWYNGMNLYRPPPEGRSHLAGPCRRKRQSAPSAGGTGCASRKAAALCTTYTMPRFTAGAVERVSVMIKVAPSILPPILPSGRDIEAISTADYVHVDVMDGLFVPNISIGIPVVKSIRPTTTPAADVHLMIDRPVRYVGAVLRCRRRPSPVMWRRTPREHPRRHRRQDPRQRKRPAWSSSPEPCQRRAALHRQGGADPGDDGGGRASAVRSSWPT